MTIRQRMYDLWWRFLDEIDKGARPDYWYAFALCSLVGSMTILGRLASEMAS